MENEKQNRMGKMESQKIAPGQPIFAWKRLTDVQWFDPQLDGSPGSAALGRFSSLPPGGSGFPWKMKSRVSWGLHETTNSILIDTLWSMNRNSWMLFYRMARTTPQKTAIRKYSDKKAKNGRKTRI